MKKRAYTDLDIEALIDGELEPEQARQVRRFIEQDLRARKFYETLRYQKHLLREWWKTKPVLNS